MKATETFTVSAGTVTNATVADGTGQVSILDDDSCGPVLPGREFC